MARKRMIDPDFWRDEKLGDCNPTSRLLFMGLISYADDEGRGRSDARLIRADVFPYDGTLSVQSVEEMLLNLQDLGLIILYQVGTQRLYQLPNFAKYQTINKPTPSKLPAPPEELFSLTPEPLREDYGSTTGGLPPNRKEENRKEKKGSEYKRARGNARSDTPTGAKRFTKPSVEEIKTYCKERKNSVDPERFYDFYESKGWKVGNSPMKDWKACVRTWEKNESGGKSNGNSQAGKRKSTLDSGEENFEW